MVEKEGREKRKKLKERGREEKKDAWKAFVMAAAVLFLSYNGSFAACFATTLTAPISDVCVKFQAEMIDTRWTQAIPVRGPHLCADQRHISVNY